MAGKNTGFQKSYRIASDNVNPDTSANEIPLYRGVVLAGDGECKLPDSDNLVPLGICDNDERVDDPIRDGGSQAGRQIAVDRGNVNYLELAGVVNVGDRIFLAVGGKGKSVEVDGVASTTYNVVGFAEKSGVAGDVIPVRWEYHVYTTA